MTWLLGNPIAQKLGAAFLAIFALFAWGKAKERKGVTKERTKQKAADNEKANYIRSRVNDAKQLHDDKLKFRD